MASAFRCSQGHGGFTVCPFSFHLVSRSENLPVPRNVALEDTLRQTHSDRNGLQSQPLRESKQHRTAYQHILYYIAFSPAWQP